jgi:hypothetical protein
VRGAVIRDNYNVGGSIAALPLTLSVSVVEPVLLALPVPAFVAVFQDCSVGAEWS